MCAYGMMCMHMGVYVYGCVCIWWLGVCISMRIVCMHKEVVYAYGCVCVWVCMHMGVYA